MSKEVTINVYTIKGDYRHIITTAISIYEIVEQIQKAMGSHRPVTIENSIYNSDHIIIIDVKL